MRMTFRANWRAGLVSACCAVLALAGIAGPLSALEPTPPDGSDEPPAVTPPPDGPIPTRLIVQFVPSEQNRVQNLTGALESAETLSTAAGVELRHVRTLSAGAQLVEVTGLDDTEGVAAQETLEQIAARLSEDPAVEYAEPDAFMRIQQAVNDPMFGQQWHYTDAATGIDLPDGWATSTGAGVTVAVIDTGFRPHADLAANLVQGHDFVTNVTIANDGDGRDTDASDPGDWVENSETWCPVRPQDSSWHGTHVAGTIAAVTDNALGVAGVARSARIVPVRVLGKCGGNLSDIVDGMRWAAGLAVPGVPANANPASVLNLSLGGGGACGATYQNAVDDILASGVTIVVAAGNSNSDASGFRPANCTGVITVAATSIDGARSYYSNFGAAVEIAAPGGETYADPARGILSTLNAGTTVPAADNYAFYQGTSMAAPHVAGAAALLHELDPAISPGQVASILQNTAKPFPAVTTRPCTTANCGAGILDAGAAVGAVTPSPAAGGAIPWISLLLKN